MKRVGCLLMVASLALLVAACADPERENFHSSEGSVIWDEPATVADNWEDAYKAFLEEEIINRISRATQGYGDLSTDEFPMTMAVYDINKDGAPELYIHWTFQNGVSNLYTYVDGEIQSALKEDCTLKNSAVYGVAGADDSCNFIARGHTVGTENMREAYRYKVSEKGFELERSISGLLIQEKNTIYLVDGEEVDYEDMMDVWREEFDPDTTASRRLPTMAAEKSMNTIDEVKEYIRDALNIELDIE